MSDRISLPIDAVLPEIIASLRAHPQLVLEAPPGAGKTTRVPPAILDAGLAGQGEVIVLEPRRLAARLSARRVAQERGERPGETVGYQVRFEDVSGPRTRLRYVTEGILARRLLADPELAGVSVVVLDEFHERHLQSDVALALLRRLQRTRRELKLVVMSATIEAVALALELGCPVVRSEGRRFAVDTIYLEHDDDRRIGDQVAAAVRRATVPGTEGDVLVFLPGAAEIRFSLEACGELAAHRGLQLRALHGDLPPDEQDGALAAGPQRKVIFATNVAETSVTIPGVTTVIDTGLARIASHSPWSGLPRLEVAKISRASAAQRAGRAGRTAPGRCFRLYTRADHDNRVDHHPPELLRLDLAETVLELRAAGLDPEALPWIDPPPPGSLHAAHALLKQLGLVDARGLPTPLGKRAARFPLHPRLSRLLLEAEARGAGAHGCTLAALLGERDLRTGRDARLATSSGVSDLDELLGRFGEAQRARFSADRLRAMQIDPGGARRVESAREQIARALGVRPASGGPTQAQETSLRIAALAAFPDRVCKRRAPGSQELIFASGSPATLAESSCVRDAQLLVALDAEERRSGTRGGVQVRLASAVEPEWLLDLFTDELRETTEASWEPARQRVEVLSRLNYGSIVLEESRRPPRLDDPAESEQAAAILLSQLRQGGGRALEPELQASLDELKARVELIAKHCPEAGLKPIEDADVDAALREAARGSASLAALREKNIQSILFVSLGPDAAGKLARLAPEQVALPGGRRLRVEYVLGQPPAARSRLQDFFGSAKGPAVCNGRVPLVLHLLSPNGRAQQVTTDLEGFWVRHYPAVRKELMRKYPRHSWPEDGRTAAPPPPVPQRGRK